MQLEAYESEARSYIEYVLNDKRFSGMLQNNSGTNSGTNSDSGHGGNTGGNTVSYCHTLKSLYLKTFQSQTTSKLIRRTRTNQTLINRVNQIAKAHLMNDFQVTCSM